MLAVGMRAARVYSLPMLADILRRLTQPHEPSPLAAGDVDLALAALLVRAARADGSYDDGERDRIGRILARRNAQGPFELAKLLSQAEDLEAKAPDTVRFTRVIKDGIAYEDRESVIEAMWEIVLSDGNRSQDEDALLRLVANLLGVNDRDSGLARQRVANRLSSTA